MRDLNEISWKNVIEDYENGVSLEEIRTRIGIPKRIIKSKLLTLGGERGKAILLKELEKDFPMINEIMKEYKQRKTVKQISEQYKGINVSRAIRQYEMITGETFPINNPAIFRRDDIPKEKVIKDYGNGRIMSDLATEQKVAVSTIKRIVDSYVIEHGDEIVEQHDRNKRTYNGIGLPIEEIIERRKDGETFKSIGKDYQVDTETIKQEVKSYYSPIVNLSLIIGYFKLGYNLEQIQEFCRKNGHEMKQEDIEIAKKIEKGELKVASEASIIEIIKKYGYSYEELVEVGEKKGYIILEDKYNSAQATIQYSNKNKNKEGEEK